MSMDNIKLPFYPFIVLSLHHKYNLIMKTKDIHNNDIIYNMNVSSVIFRIILKLELVLFAYIYIYILLQ